MEYILIHHSQLDELEKLAVTTLPNESCAILLGKKSKTKSIVQHILPMNNSYHSSIEFNIESDDLYEAYNKARIMNLNILAIFHSHPAKPIPSTKDIWLIYSTSSHTFKAFIIDKEDEIKEINLLVIKD
jgi:proteasome lid subunit RPN8/RPN11